MYTELINYLFFAKFACGIFELPRSRDSSVSQFGKEKIYNFFLHKTFPLTDSSELLLYLVDDDFWTNCQLASEWDPSLRRVLASSLDLDKDLVGTIHVIDFSCAPWSNEFSVHHPRLFSAVETFYELCIYQQDLIGEKNFKSWVLIFLPNFLPSGRPLNFSASR